MNLLSHPASFMAGTRVLFLKSRHKDGATDERTILRVSHDQNRFWATLLELDAMAREGERIYASAGHRDVSKASRLFKERALAASYDADETEFYRHLDARWVSCLMAPAVQTDKRWLFDCDSDEDYRLVVEEISRLKPIMGWAETPYSYPSKSGRHIITGPFDKSRLSPRVMSMWHDNALMLWGY